MAELAQAQSILKETLAKVAALEAQFDEANTKKVMKKYIGAKLVWTSGLNTERSRGSRDSRSGTGGRQVNTTSFNMSTYCRSNP